MAKKSKRRVNRSTSRSTVAPVTPAESTRSFDRDFNPDYTHVINDLKRIGTLAASFLVILVILSFILR
jgi:hypothetical protein